MLMGIIQHMLDTVKRVQHKVELNEMHLRTVNRDKKSLRNQRVIPRRLYVAASGRPLVGKCAELNRCSVCQELFRGGANQLVCYECMNEEQDRDLAEGMVGRGMV